MATNTQRKTPFEPGYVPPRSVDPLDPVDPGRPEYVERRDALPPRAGESRVGMYIVIALAIIAGLFMFSYYGSRGDVSSTTTSSESTTVAPPALQPETTTPPSQPPAAEQPPPASGQNGTTSGSGSSGTSP